MAQFLVTPKYHLLQHHIEKQCFLGFSLMRTKRPTGVHKSMVSNVISARLQVALPVNCSVHVKNSVELWNCVSGSKWESEQTNHKETPASESVFFFSNREG